MNFKLLKISGYEEAILSLRMSKGKYYSWEKAQKIQELVYSVTGPQGFLLDREDYYNKNYYQQGTGEERPLNYEADVAEFERLLGLTMNNAMGEQKHHTLMKYIDISFITEGLHRGAQDDLDAHAIGFNNRITRFSTRLAEIPEVKLSEWYEDKVIPFADVVAMVTEIKGEHPLPFIVEVGGEEYERTPFGYVLKKFAQVPAKNGLAKDVQRGLMPLGMESSGLWKTDLFNLRYIYKMRSKLTKANPELKAGMEQLADQLEAALPVFGPKFRQEYTDSGVWEHLNKLRTISSEEFQQFKKWQKAVGTFKQ